MLDRQFFRERLSELREEYKIAANAEEPALELMLRSGIVLLANFEDVRAESDYLIVDYKQRGEKRRAILPYDGLVAVGFAPEAPEAKNKSRLGFAP